MCSLVTKGVLEPTKNNFPWWHLEAFLLFHRVSLLFESPVSMWAPAGVSAVGVLVAALCTDHREATYRLDSHTPRTHPGAKAAAQAVGCRSELNLTTGPEFPLLMCYSIHCPISGDPGIQRGLRNEILQIIKGKVQEVILPFSSSIFSFSRRKFKFRWMWWFPLFLIFQAWSLV